MSFTDIWIWLQGVDWLREAIGTTAIFCGFIAKWKIGNGKIQGWVWGFAGSFFWMFFALRIESPTGFLNNLVFLWLAVRGYKLWKKNDVRGAAQNVE